MKESGEVDSCQTVVLRHVQQLTNHYALHTTHTDSPTNLTVLEYEESVFLFWNEEVSKTSALTAGVKIFPSVNVSHTLSHCNRCNLHA